MALSRYRDEKGNILNLSETDVAERRNRGLVFELIGPKRYATEDQYLTARQADTPEIMGAMLSNSAQKQLAAKEDELAKREAELAERERALSGGSNPQSPEEVQTKKQDADEVKNKARTTK